MKKILEYGGVPEEECEVVIRLDKQDGMAYICSTWAPMSRKLEKRYGAPIKVVEREGKWISAFWKVPVNRISFRSPVKHRPSMSPEQRKAAGERLNPARARS